MDYHGRRNRRGRERRTRQATTPPTFVVRNPQKGWSLMDGISSIFIMTSLLAIIYLMLDYHCTVCSANCDLSNITKTIDEVSSNISVMKDSYNDLEMKIKKFSYELPKIEGQIEILEAFANSVAGGDHRSFDSYNIVGPKRPHLGNSRNVTKHRQTSTTVKHD